jgi:hypothetical protein
MIQRDLQQLAYDLRQPGCAKLAHRIAVEHGIAPNHFKFLHMCGVLECIQSSDGDDFAVSVGGVEYAIQLENATPGVQCYVVLIDRNGNVVARITAKKFKAMMNGHMPRQSSRQDYGPYYWVDKEFRSADRGLARNIVDRPPWVNGNYRQYGGSDA